jgi:cell division septation protein DedD
MFKIRSKTKGQGKRYSIELTSISALFWSIFLFFLLIWIFVLGILVGRGFFPGSLTTVTDLKSQIKTLQGMLGDKKTVDATASKETDSDPKLAFYDKLTSKKDEIKNNPKPETKVDASAIEKEKPPVENKPAQKVLTEEKVIVEVPEKNEKSQPTTLQIMYTVQVASIGDKEKAETMIKNLNGQGYDAYYYEVDVKGVKYYRIRCGRLPTRDDASKYSQRLEEESGLKGYVTRIE